ncbi:MAG TPA: hypothetical protein VJT72_13815 [Pseudonocardiaceae bacterium]|nr:hypothetical protein [Pseudonocardiaceae bacterium]
MQIDGFRSHSVYTVSDQLDAISILPSGYHPGRTGFDYFTMDRSSTFSTGYLPQPSPVRITFPASTCDADESSPRGSTESTRTIYCELINTGTAGVMATQKDADSVPIGRRQATDRPGNPRENCDGQDNGQKSSNEGELPAMR